MTPHASTGSTMVFFVCTLSLGHMRLAFRSTSGWQLNLIVRPASVSWGRTVWMYMRASRSSFSPGGAEELVRSSEFRLFRRPTGSDTWLSARSRSLRFIARTMFSLSSCEPAPTWAVDEASGPHCFGGALVEVRRCEPSSGFRFLAAAEGSLELPSFPSTLVARPWIADHEFPHIPDSVFWASFPARSDCEPERSNDDVGVDAAL